MSFYSYSNKTKKIKTPIFTETSQVRLLQRRFKLTGTTGPLLQQAMNDAKWLHIGNGRNHYDFKVYSFGEVGSLVSGELMNEIVKGLDEMITKSQLKFDYLVSQRYGARWAFLVGAKRNAKVLFISERPRRLMPQLDKWGEHSIDLRTRLYRRKVYFRNVKANDKAIIIDDVISAGRTVNLIIEAFRKLNVQVLGVFCIVAKGEGYKSVEEKGVSVWYLAHELYV